MLLRSAIFLIVLLGLIALPLFHPLVMQAADAMNSANADFAATGAKEAAAKNDATPAPASTH